MYTLVTKYWLLPKTVRALNLLTYEGPVYKYVMSC